MPINVWIAAGEVVFLCVICFFILFCLTSLREKETRAFRRSGFLLVLLIGTNMLLFLLKEPLRQGFFAGIFILVTAGVLVLLASPKPRTSLKVVSQPERIDERDIIFTRFDLKKESPRYKEYYSRRPEYKEVDDNIRERPDILTPPHIKKNPLLFNLAAAEFDFLEQQLDFVDGETEGEGISVSAEDFTSFLKKVLRYLGAADSGVCLMDQRFLYSHVGRGPETYGAEIVNEHKYAVVFVLEKDYDMISCAPEAPVVVETARRYVDIARIGIVCARLIRRLGYAARAHIAGSNYQTMVTPLAWKAGLGEVGRIGVLIHPRLGPRIRLGVITTDIPLVPSSGPRGRGILDFCEKCRKCALNCPGKAIPDKEKVIENGVEKWVIDREKCYYYWRKAGTDCSICIMSCPYSKPDNFFHNIIRMLAASSRWIQPLLVKGDDFFYGKHPRRKKPPF